MSSIPPVNSSSSPYELRSRKRNSEEENPESKRVTRAAAKAMEETEGSKNAPSARSHKATKVPKEQPSRTMRAAARDIAKSNPEVASSSSKKRGSEQASPAGKRAQKATSNAADPNALFKKLTEGVQDESGRRRIREELERIPEAERASVISAAAPLMAEEMDGFDRADIIRVVGSIPMADRMSVIQAAAPFMEGVMSGFVIASRISAVRHIPIDERENIIQAAAPLMARRMSGSKMFNIFITLADIPRDDRMSVIQAAAPLLARGMDDRASANIIIAVKRIPIDERMSVSQAAALLMASGMDGRARADIIRMVGRIPQAQREAKTEAIKRLVDGLEAGEKQYCIHAVSSFSLDTINAIAARPVADRLRAVQEAHGGFSAESITSYTVTVSRDKIKAEPRAVLHDLVEKFKVGEKSRLNVAFLGEVGIDASGLSREFVTLLFDSLKSNLHFGICNNGLHRLTELQSDEEKAVYRELGQLMQFCLNAENYPIGMIFDAGVFVALSKLLQNENLDEISFERYFEAFTALHCNEDDKNKMRLIQAALEQQRSGVSDEVTGNPVQVIEESMKPYLEIARGMKSAPFTKITWQNVRDMAPEEFSTKIQGRFSKELVLNNLGFEESTPAEKQEWVREWIQNAPDEKVKQFLFAMTGSYAVGRVALQIANRGENIYFHTCFNSVDMPLDKIESKELFVSLLESAISDPGKYSRS